MKTIRFFAAMCCMALLVPVWTGCSDDDTASSDSKPEITVVKPAESDITSDRATFEIRTKHADKAAWMIRESTASAPSAQEILQDGVLLLGQSPYTVTAVGLKAGTGYTIYAAGAKGAVASAVATAEYTTAAAELLPVARITPPAESAVTQHSVSFEITTENADKAAWAIRESTAAAPSAQEIMEDGTQLSGQSPYQVTAEGLKANTEYKIYAAASLEGTAGEVASADAKTLAVGLLTVQEVGKNFVRYHIEVAADVTYRHLIISKYTYDSFVGYAATPDDLARMITSMLSIYGQTGTGPADYTHRDLQENPNSPRPYDVLAGMPYVAIACQTDAGGTQYTGSCQVEELHTLAPERLSSSIGVEISNLTPQSADVMCTPDAGLVCLYENILMQAEVAALKLMGDQELEIRLLTSVAPTTELGKLSEWGYLYEDTQYVHCVVGIDADGNRTSVVESPFETPALPEVDLTNLTFEHVVSASYYGEAEPGVHDFYMIFSDKPMILDPEDEYGGSYIPTSFPCHTFICDFYTSAPVGGRLPEGTYTYDSSNENVVAGTLDSDYTFSPYFGESADDYREFYFDSGTITVSYEGANYRITADFVTEEGNTFTGSYTGPIDFAQTNSALRKMSHRVGMPGSSVLRR